MNIYQLMFGRHNLTGIGIYRFFLGVTLSLASVINFATDTAAQELIWSMSGETSGDDFGFDVALVGDFNNDGHDDFVVGAPGYPAGSDTGRVYVYFGGESPPATLVLNGEDNNGRFGYSVAGAGDVNNDGFADIIVGAPRFDIPGKEDAGRAYIYFGADPPDDTVDLFIDGAAAEDRLGEDVSTAGHFNSDEFDDVVVGVPYSNESPGGSDAGAVYILYGGDPPDNVVDISILGEAKDDRLGQSIACAGDWDGDGWDDVVMGADHHDLSDTLGHDQGRAYIVFGGQYPTGVPEIILNGDNNQFVGRFGRGVAPAGDINGDNYPDLLIGAYFRGDTVSNEGRAYLFFGGAERDTVRDLTLKGRVSDNWSNFGYTLTGLDDANGDGFDDFAVSAWYDDLPATGSGRVYFYLGGETPDAEADLQLAGTIAHDHYGRSLSRAGEIGDVIIGAPDADSGKGRAELWDLWLNHPPAAPSDLTLTPVSSHEIILNWTDSSSNEIGFRVYRGLSEDSVTSLIATLGRGIETFTDTELGQDTTYYYRLDAYNDNGPSSTDVDSATTFVLPNGILLEATGNVGQVGLISANLSDNAVAASLHYRPGGSVSFADTSMARVGKSNSWLGLIRANAMGMEGIQYYLTVSSSTDSATLPAGAPSTALASMSVINPAYTFFNLRPNTHHFLGIPIDPDEQHEMWLFDELGAYDKKQWRYWTAPYQEDGGGGGHYTEHPDASPPILGQGFWIISRSGSSISFSGKSTRLDQDFEIPLAEGWNLIANPFAFLVSWNDIGWPDSITQYSTWINNDYNYDPILEPGVGYWLRNHGSEGAVLTIPPIGTSKGPGKTNERNYTELPLDDPGWSVLAGVRAGDFADSVNRLGLRINGTAEEDWFDYLDPPIPPGNHVTLSLINPEGQRFLTDYRSLDSPGETWTLLLFSNLTGTDFELELTLDRPLPEGWHLHAIDLDELTEIDLSTQSTIRGKITTQNYERSWYIAAGSMDYLGGVRQEVDEEFASSVTTFSLGPVYPNPFESTTGTVIKLAAPKSTSGSVRVYDVRGRLVREIHSGEIRRGHLRFVWYGRDDSGQRLASGVYFIRLAHGDEQHLRKVVLLR